MIKATDPATHVSGDEQTFTGPLDGSPITIKAGFSARSFRARDIGPSMDPLVMVDHYVMTEDTFGEHPHAGLSAVSLILPDSEGRFHNRDSLGNDIDLLPGDLYWLNAGSGAMHHERPRTGARTHGLQVFVNVPQALRHEAPSSLLVRQEDMPEICSDKYRVRLAVGESNGFTGARVPGLPMTVLYGYLATPGSFQHKLGGDRNAWVHAIDGDLDVALAGETVGLAKGQAIAIDNAMSGEAVDLRISGRRQQQAQFALLEGQAIREPFVQRGPFVMGSTDELDAIERAFKEGQFG